jgi:nuclear pore complex protein Nup85
VIKRKSNPLQLITILQFQQWEGLLELLGSDIGSAGGLEFLHRYFFVHQICLIVSLHDNVECQLRIYEYMIVPRYRDFKRSLQQALDRRCGEAARQTVDFLIQVKF